MDKSFEGIQPLGAGRMGQHKYPFSIWCHSFLAPPGTPLLSKFILQGTVQIVGVQQSLDTMSGEQGTRQTLSDYYSHTGTRL